MNSSNLKFFTLRQGQYLNHAKNFLVDLPSPIKMSYFWKFGSLIGIYLCFQVLSGLFLSMFYTPLAVNAFESVKIMTREVKNGWVIRLLHIIGSSCFFLFMYFHMGRGIYYNSFVYKKIWLSGVTLLLMSMATSFFGYVLPWGQMSYWGATVITKFFSVVPYVGNVLVIWMWGSFSVDYPTLTRFFSLHFMLPFIMMVFTIIHLVFMHETGSKKPIGLNSKGDKIPFKPYFLVKDVLGFLISFLVVFMFFLYPEQFLEYQNFIQAKVLVTPSHIQPEWYFLAAYAVLRAMPKKLGGVISLGLFVMILYFLPIMCSKVINSKGFKLMTPLVWWWWMKNFFLLTWVGSCPVEHPFIILCQFGSIFYFLFYMYQFWLKTSSYMI